VSVSLNNLWLLIELALRVLDLNPGSDAADAERGPGWGFGEVGALERLSLGSPEPRSLFCRIVPYPAY
jgi:hypothetical protein